MAGENLITGIDIGTAKVCTVIADVGRGGLPKILGVGQSRSGGVKRGAVVDVERTVKAVARSVDDAEKMAGVSVDEAYVGIAGSHIESVTSPAVIAVSHADEITGVDIDRVLEQARAVAIPSERRVLHVLPIEFAVDDQTGIRNPVGMSGVRLETEVLIVSAAETSARNVEKCVCRAGVEVRELVLESLASSFSILEEDEQELGVLLVDLGGGTADLTIFLGGSIRFTASLGIGGEHVTNDIAIGLRTPSAEAEALKIHFGAAVAPDEPMEEEIEVPGIGGRADRTVSRAVLCSIIESRMAEILELACREARRTGLLDLLGGGVVLCGGGAEMPAVAQMAETLFEMPVKIGTPRGVGGLTDEVRRPRFATAAGLVQYGQAREGKCAPLVEPKPRRGKGIRRVYRMKSWLKAVVNQF